MSHLRYSSQSVWLNRRLIHFPLGASALDIFASLAKHTPMDDKARRLPRAKGCLYGKGGAGKMPEHPLENIAHTVAWRLANPTNRAFINREVKRAPGSNQHKAIVKNDGKLYGSKAHSMLENGSATARSMSAHDIEEIRGCVSLVLATLGNPEKLDFAAWKAIFAASRATLGMKRKVNRENLVDSLSDIDFHSELKMDSALIASLAEEQEEVEREEQAKRDRIAQAARGLRAFLQAAKRGDTSRRSKANYETACRYLRRAIRAALGQGHGHTLTRTAAYKQNTAFVNYLANGEAQAAMEAREAATAAQVAQDALLMYAVGE